MSAPYKPGDTVWAEFCTSVFSTGAAGNATGTPIGTLNRNGTDDAAVTPITVANVDTGRYTVTFVIPTSYVGGDELNLSIAATVSGVAGKAVVWRTRLGYPQQTNAFVDVISGSCTSNGTTATIIDTSLSAYASLTGRVVIWRTGANIGSQVQITAHTAGGTTLTVAVMGNASASGDKYEIY